LVLAAFLGSLFLSTAASPQEAAAPAAIPADTADAILIELRAIRALLENIEKQGSSKTKRAARPATAKVAISGQPAMGDPEAPVTVVEFTDYQCPFCLRFTENTFPALKEKYIDTGKVRWVAFNLPMSFHPHARKAAQAALCAGDQGMFWEMRTVLFQNPQKLDEKYLPGYAGDLSLDVAAFEACLNGDSHLADIEREAKAANAVRLTGTPSFIIGKTASDEISGRVIIGAQKLTAFESAIQQALEQHAAMQPGSAKPAT
ncbi:MAG: thioredoxin domain-containing protein, partial [Gammaproteobacteria bacterium]